MSSTNRDGSSERISVIFPIAKKLQDLVFADLDERGIVERSLIRARVLFLTVFENNSPEIEFPIFLVEKHFELNSEAFLHDMENKIIHLS